MLSRTKLSPFIQDVGLTAASSAVTIILMIIVTRLLAQGLGSEEFGAYSLSRQVISTLMPFATLASGVAIARYIPMTADWRMKRTYLLCGCLIVLVSGCLLFMVNLFFRDSLSSMIFRSSSYSNLLFATFVMLFGYSMYAMLYSFYRGMGQMWKANLWQVAVMAIGPAIIAIAYAGSKDVKAIVMLMGIISFSAIIPLTAHIIRAIKENAGSINIEMKETLRKLLRYGLPRVPGGFAFAGILAVGPFLMPYIDSLKGAGYLVVGQSIFRIVEGGVEAFGIVALPKIAQLVAENKGEFLRGRITDIIALVFHLGMFATFHLLLWTDYIVLAWLGSEYVEAVPVLRILVAALIPYLSYAMLRSIVDAVDVKAVNTFNLFLSLIITVLISLISVGMGLGITGLAVSTTTGLTALGLLTARYLWKTYSIECASLMINKCLLANAVCIAVALICKLFLLKALSGAALLSAAALAEGIIFTLYIFAIWKMRAPWMIELKNRILKTT